MKEVAVGTVAGVLIILAMFFVAGVSIGISIENHRWRSKELLRKSAERAKNDQQIDW